MTDPPPPHPAPPRPNAPTPPAIPVISSAELLGGGREVLIEHEGEFYRLRRTRTGKLILQK